MENDTAAVDGTIQYLGYWRNYKILTEEELKAIDFSYPPEPDDWELDGKEKDGS